VYLKLQWEQRGSRALCVVVRLTVPTGGPQCSVADYFMMVSLRMEALCIICQKAEPSHLPLLQDFRRTFNVEGLDACLRSLSHKRTREGFEGLLRRA
jgi:hypothetical protein